MGGGFQHSYGLIWFDLVRLAPKAIGRGVWLYQARLGWIGLDYQGVSPSAECGQAFHH
jgi:hypothetical protein